MHAYAVKLTVQNEVKTFGEQLKNDLGNQIASIHSKIDNIQTDFNNQLSEVKKNVDSCMHRSNTSEDDFQRITE